MYHLLSESMNSFDSVSDAIHDIAMGKMVIVTNDDPGKMRRLIMAASKVTPEAINHMIVHAGVNLCPLTQ